MGSPPRPKHSQQQPRTHRGGAPPGAESTARQRAGRSSRQCSTYTPTQELRHRTGPRSTPTKNSGPRGEHPPPAGATPTTSSNSKPKRQTYQPAATTTPSLSSRPSAPPTQRHSRRSSSLAPTQAPKDVHEGARVNTPDKPRPRKTNPTIHGGWTPSYLHQTALANTTPRPYNNHSSSQSGPTKLGPHQLQPTLPTHTRPRHHNSINNNKSGHTTGPGPFPPAATATANTKPSHHPGGSSQPQTWGSKQQRQKVLAALGGASLHSGTNVTFVGTARGDHSQHQSPHHGWSSSVTEDRWANVPHRPQAHAPTQPLPHNPSIQSSCSEAPALRPTPAQTEPTKQEMGELQLEEGEQTQLADLKQTA